MLIQMSRLGPASIASGVDLDGLKVVLETAARTMDLPAKAVAVVTLTGDERLREYNNRYRGLDEPTDVLAFAAREQATDQRFQSPPGTEDWLGDIVIPCRVRGGRRATPGTPSMTKYGCSRCTDSCTCWATTTRSRRRRRP